MLPLVTFALILTAVRNDLSLLFLSLNGHGVLMGWLIRFHVPLMFGKLARRLCENSTVSHTGHDITNISRNLQHGQRLLQNPAQLN